MQVLCLGPPGASQGIVEYSEIWIGPLLSLIGCLKDRQE